jgi:hypothetical protein
MHEHQAIAADHCTLDIHLVDLVRHRIEQARCIESARG